MFPVKNTAHTTVHANKKGVLIVILPSCRSSFMKDSALLRLHSTMPVTRAVRGYELTEICYEPRANTSLRQ